MLMYLMENNEDIFALLKEYFNSKDLKPFSNYLHDKFSDNHKKENKYIGKEADQYENNNKRTYTEIQNLSH